jgi:hypothetical protein
MAVKARYVSSVVMVSTPRAKRPEVNITRNQLFQNTCQCFEISWPFEAALRHLRVRVSEFPHAEVH